MSEIKPQDEDWTIWRVLMHPAAARDAIDESNIEMMSLQENLDKMTDAFEQQKNLCDRMSGENKTLRAELGELSRELEKTRESLASSQKELRATLDELSLHKSVGERLAEFEAELEKVEEMKRRYENQISFLKKQLRIEKNRKRGYSDDEALDEMYDEGYGMTSIDMGVSGDADASSSDGNDAGPRNGLIQPGLNRHGGVGHNGRTDLAETPLERLRPVYGKTDPGKTEGNKERPEGKPAKKYDELRRAYFEKRADGLPENTQDCADGDSWLLDFPDSF